MLVKHAVEQVEAILTATTDESVYEAVSTRADELPTERIYYYRDLPPHEDVAPE